MNKSLIKKIKRDLKLEAFWAESYMVLYIFRLENNYLLLHISVQGNILHDRQNEEISDNFKFAYFGVFILIDKYVCEDI